MLLTYIQEASVDIVGASWTPYGHQMGPETVNYKTKYQM